MTDTDNTPDHRPVKCRFRLQDEGKAYPRSSCTACGKGVLSGLGNKCSHTRPQPAVTVKPLDDNGSEILVRLKAACTGTPAKIKWPHRLLHDAIAEIEECHRNIGVKADWINATLDDLSAIQPAPTTDRADALREAANIAETKHAAPPPGIHGFQGDMHVAGLKISTAIPDLIDTPAPPQATVQALPDDLLTHRSAWRNALVLAEVDAEVTPPDIDDKLIWRHELAAFDRVFEALRAIAEQGGE